MTEAATPTNPAQTDRSRWIALYVLCAGLVNATVQVGGAMGLAVLATLASERTDGLRTAGQSTAAALNSGYHLAYLVGAALVVSGFLVALTVLRSESAQEVDEDERSPAATDPAYSYSA